MTFEEWEQTFMKGRNPAACDYSYDDMKVAWLAGLERGREIEREICDGILGGELHDRDRE